MSKFNFYAGPAILPKEVFAEAAEAVKDFNGMGLSILEISHRSKEFQAVMDEAQTLSKDLLDVPESHEVLFLQGGASSQFMMTPMNVLGEGDTAAFIDTGNWSAKAIKEAKLFGQTEVVASSKEDGYKHIPKDFSVPAEAKYLHITSNNTVAGTQYATYPDVAIPIVADMSSDIFSRTLDVSKFGLIYAGAQKNMGPSGTTLVIVDKSFVTEPVRPVPTMLNYNTHIGKQSMFNTPPVFPVYVSMLTMRWVKAKGGVQVMDEINARKAAHLYDYLDQSSLFFSPIAKEDRSKMNAVFLMRDESLNDAFLAAATDAGCIGVKGHRSVGGFRASIYNAMPEEGVKTLVEVMAEFERSHA